MKIHPFSDLHIPHHIRNDGKTKLLDLYKNFLDGFFKNLPDVDVYVIAGDFHDVAYKHGDNILQPLLNHFAEAFPKKEIIYIPGNHEFYKTSFDGVYSNKRYLLDNIHWLHRDTFELNNVIFAGDTLWFPHTVMTDCLKYRLNDFGYIQLFENWVYRENELSQNFFKNQLIHNDPNKTLVCVSHHLPCENVVSHENINDDTNIFYVGSYDLFNYIGSKNIIWIHGHSHEPIDKMLGETRVIRNPYGYDSISTQYRENLIIEV